MERKNNNKGRFMATLWLMGMFPLFVMAMIAIAAQQIFGIVVGRVYHSILKQLNKHYYYYAWLESDLSDCESILELGCGDHSPLLAIGYGHKTDSIDIWRPYIEKHNKAGDYRKCWEADICNMEWPEAKSYDAVVIFDVMEHLPKQVAENNDYLFKNMERCARKKVICFTPNGFVENDEVDGDPWQAHLSAWEPDDYKKRGYKVLGGTGLRWLFGKASLPRKPEILFYALGMLTQPLIYHFPDLAWHSYAVKDVE